MTTPESEPEKTPAEIAVRLVAMSQQLMDQLELYAKDLQALHAQRSQLRVAVRRAQWQAASAEREQERLREQLEERLQQPPPLPPPVAAAPRPPRPPAPPAPKPTARRPARHLPAVVGTAVVVAGLGLAAGVGIVPSSVSSDPVNGPAAVATQVALVTRIALVTRVVPADARPGATPTSAAAAAAMRPYMTPAASPSPAADETPPAGTPTAGLTPTAATPTPAAGGARTGPSTAADAGAGLPTGRVGATPGPGTTGGAAGAPEPTPNDPTRARRPHLDIDPTDRPPILARMERLGPPHPEGTRPEAPSRSSVGGPKGAPGPAASPAAASAPTPSRCALDVVVPALRPRTAFVVRVKQEKEDQVVVLWPDARGGVLLASGQPPDGAASTSVMAIKHLPSALLIAEPTELEAAATVPPGGVVAAFLNETDRPIEPSRAVLMYFGGTRCP